MSQKFYTLITQQGAALLANATALGKPLKLSKMAVGDANGNTTTPNASQTKLIHKVYQAPLNSLTIDEKNPNQIIAELVIPENQGGWFINEIGLYDENDTLVAVGNCPATYKPQLSEGSGRTQVIRMIIVVDNVNAVALKIDPSVVLATRQYVDDLITSKMTAHEKSTNHPNATTKSKGFVQLNSAIDSNLENQAATPLAVKKVNDNVIHAHARINGVDEYAKSINNEVVSAHSRISQVHNYSKEVDGRVTLANNRISQVHDYSKVVSGRVDNIADKFQPSGFESRMYSQDKRFYQVVRDDGLVGMYSLVKKGFSWSINHDGWIDGYLPASRIGKLDEFVRDRTPPVGVPMPWPQVNPPAGYFECNGSTFDKSKFPRLAVAYPTGKLPDLRGEFIRGWDNTRGVDPRRGILSGQAQQISAHRHVGGWGENSTHFTELQRENYAPFGKTGINGIWGGASGNDFDNALVYTNNGTNGSIRTSRGETYWNDLNPAGLVGNETRPRNIAFMYIVKAE